MHRLSIIALGVVLAAINSAGAQHSATTPDGVDSRNRTALSDEEAVKAVVNRFLVAIGSYDLEALPAMFATNANIASVHLGDGQWHTRTYTFDEFYSILSAREDPSPYEEPVSHFTIHVEDGGLAFVRADATLIRDGQPRSHNIDYFTLIKEEGTWRFLSASYVATPITQD